MEPAIIAIVLSILALLSSIALLLQISKAKKTIQTLTTGIKTGNIEQLVEHFSKILEQTDRDYRLTMKDFAALREEHRHYFRKVGLVRFSAFKDTGSDQSFAMALLDENNNGFVISSLYGRDISRTYAKEIKSGTSEKYRLTEEEQQALENAIKQ